MMTQVWATGSNKGAEQKDDGFFLLLLIFLRNQPTFKTAVCLLQVSHRKISSPCSYPCLGQLQLHNYIKEFFILSPNIHY